MSKPNITQEYERLHQEYLAALVHYHNVYLKYIKGKQARADLPVLRKALKDMIQLNREMWREASRINKAKVAYHAEQGMYEGTKAKNKTRWGKEDINTVKD